MFSRNSCGECEILHEHLAQAAREYHQVLHLFEPASLEKDTAVIEKLHALRCQDREKYDLARNAFHQHLDAHNHNQTASREGVLAGSIQTQ